VNTHTIFSEVAEQAVLGGLLINPAAWRFVEEKKLQKKHFYVEAHQIIFESMQTIRSQDRCLDAFILVDFLTVTELLGKAGGEVYIYELANNTP